ncbi:MAG: hypothetical protein CMI12_03780, partial [Oceanospirillum sp.]|nr:hypothetical protein [Oceanospirillum sp.]
EVAPCQKKSALFIKHFNTKQNAKAASRAAASTSAKLCWRTFRGEAATSAKQDNLKSKRFD